MGDGEAEEHLKSWAEKRALVFCGAVCTQGKGGAKHAQV